MTTTLRVAAFLAGLAVVFGVALGVGNAIGPAEVATPEEHGGGHEMEMSDEPASTIPGGLMVSQDGYTLRLSEANAEPGRAAPVAFTIDGPNGQPVTRYDVEHEKRLHFIAVRRDFSGFQHVHPTLDAQGVWSTNLDLTPGQWRLFADFKAAGADKLTLGADLGVSGRPTPSAAAPDVVRTARVDGYRIDLAGELRPGSDSKLTVSVTRGDRPVTDLQPYLGAYGHLVALREGDLAYLHVHPDGTPGDGKTRSGPDVVFYASVPSAGAYHLYLDVKIDGVVRTAAFALDTGGTSTSKEAPDDHDH